MPAAISRRNPSLRFGDFIRLVFNNINEIDLAGRRSGRQAKLGRDGGIGYRVVSYLPNSSSFDQSKYGTHGGEGKLTLTYMYALARISPIFMIPAKEEYLLIQGRPTYVKIA
jgi:hypothetical protein